MTDTDQEGTLVRGADGALYLTSPNGSLRVADSAVRPNLRSEQSSGVTNAWSCQEHVSAQVMVDPGDQASAQVMIEAGDHASARVMVDPGDQASAQVMIDAGEAAAT